MELVGILLLLLTLAVLAAVPLVALLHVLDALAKRRRGTDATARAGRDLDR